MGTHILECFLSDAFMGRVFLILFPRRAWPACADVTAVPLPLWLWDFTQGGGCSLGPLAVRSGPLTVCVADAETPRCSSP